MAIPDSPRLRRSCLSVPGSNPKMLANAATLEADEILVDLEDAVAPLAKTDETRAAVAEALVSHQWRSPTLAVRVNGVETQWCYRDIEMLVTRAGARLDCLVIPKVEDPSHVHFVAHLLDQIECAHNLTRPIGLEILIETARGVVSVERIAVASPRIEALIFGPGDYAASLGVPQLSVGTVEQTYPGHQWHYPLSRIATTARANGFQAIDGAFSAIRDPAGFRTAARTSRLLGFDGKWAIHPDQVAVCNEVYSPTQAEYDRAERILDAYRGATEVNRRGAIILDEEMIDEATRKMAFAVAVRGRAAGMTQSART